MKWLGLISILVLAQNGSLLSLETPKYCYTTKKPHGLTIVTDKNNLFEVTDKNNLFEHMELDREEIPEFIRDFYVESRAFNPFFSSYCHQKLIGPQQAITVAQIIEQSDPLPCTIRPVQDYFIFCNFNDSLSRLKHDQAISRHGFRVYSDTGITALVIGSRHRKVNDRTTFNTEVYQLDNLGNAKQRNQHITPSMEEFLFLSEKLFDKISPPPLYNKVLVSKYIEQIRLLMHQEQEKKFQDFEEFFYNGILIMIIKQSLKSSEPKPEVFELKKNLDDAKDSLSSALLAEKQMDVKKPIVLSIIQKSRELLGHAVSAYIQKLKQNDIYT